MAGMILAVPGVVPPAPIPVDHSGLVITWTGSDGVVWELTSPASGVQLMTGEVEGLEPLEPTHYTSTSAAVAGAFYRGTTYGPRPAFLPLAVFRDGSSQGWIDYYRAFVASLHPRRLGVLSVQHPDRTVRTLTARASRVKAGMGRDPSVIGFVGLGVDLVADDPFWYGADIVRTWTTGTTTPFLGAGGYGPPFYISPGRTLAGARMPNPGDEEGYPVWRLAGPATSVTVGVSGSLVSYTAPIGDGSVVTIDTRPDYLSVTDENGVDRVGNLTLANFAPIQPGDEVPLSLSMVGSGSVSATLRPPFLGAL